MRYSLLSFANIFKIIFLLQFLTNCDAKSIVNDDENNYLIRPLKEISQSSNNTTFMEESAITGSKKISQQFTSVLTELELHLFIDAMSRVSNEICRSDLNATLNGIRARQHWAISMYDAMAKSSFGIENGVLYHFGHFDECLDQYESIRADEEYVPVRYCLADVKLDGLTVQNIDKRIPRSTTNYTIAHWGACVPASCSSYDLEKFLSTFTQRTVIVDEAKCQMPARGIVFSNAMLAYAAVIFTFILLALLSTIYHIYLLCMAKNMNDGLGKSTMKNDFLSIALLSFSVIENTKKIFQASTEQLGLNSINGIKTLAMLLILFGHAVSFIFGGPAYNSSFISEHLRKPAISFLSNSLLFVDVFLLLSGFLFCRILLIELERRRGKINVLIIYAGRYIRLTPAYMVVMGFYMTWFVQVGSGPLWRERILLEQERCKESWWLNALYINNYIQTDKLCMFQSWYLCVDSQMFFLSPIAIYLLNRTRKYGLSFLSAMAMLTAIIPFVVTYVQKLDPTLLIYKDEMEDLAQNAYYVGSYIKTHMRASAYVIGLLIGFIVHIMQEKNTKLPKYLVRLIWLVAFVIGTASMHTVCRFYDPYTNLEATLYAGLHKLGWNLAVAWLVVAVTTGHALWLERILSSRIFAPLSRLTYCAYLSNGIVELYHGLVVRSPPHLSYLYVFNTGISHILDTFILAFILCLLFESPIHALERILLRKYGRRDRGASGVQQKSSSHSPSTSEEQFA